MKWREYGFDKWAGYGLLLLFIFIFQSTMGDMLAIGRVGPNLLVCALTGVAMQEGEIAGGIFGFVGGFLTDTLFAAVSGFHLILGLLFGVLIGRLTKLYIHVSVLSAMFISVILSLAYNSIIFFTHYYIAGEASIQTAFIHVILPEAAYVGAMMIPLYYLTKWLKGITAIKEQEE